MSEKACIFIRSRPPVYDLADMRKKLSAVYSHTGSQQIAYMLAMGDDELSQNIRMMDNIRFIQIPDETTAEKELRTVAGEIFPPPENRNVVMMDGRAVDATLVLDKNKENLFKTKKAFISVTWENGKYSADIYVFETGDIISKTKLKENEVYKIIEKYS